MTTALEKVSWNDIQEFISKLNQKTGKRIGFQQKLNGNMRQKVEARTRNIQEAMMLIVLHGLAKTGRQNTSGRIEKA